MAASDGHRPLPGGRATASGPCGRAPHSRLRALPGALFPRHVFIPGQCAGKQGVVHTGVEHTNTNTFTMKIIG